MRCSLGILSDVALVDSVLFVGVDFVPVNVGVDWHEHVSAKD